MINDISRVGHHYEPKMNSNLLNSCTTENINSESVKIVKYKKRLHSLTALRCDSYYL